HACQLGGRRPINAGPVDGGSSHVVESLAVNRDRAPRPSAPGQGRCHGEARAPRKAVERGRGIGRQQKVRGRGAIRGLFAVIPPERVFSGGIDGIVVTRKVHVRGERRQGYSVYAAFVCE